MGNSIIKGVNKEKSVFEEEYRFIFLHYLDVAEKTLKLRDEISHVKHMRRILKYGRNDVRSGSRLSQKNEAIRSGKNLYCNYGMQFTTDGFEHSVRCFYADLNSTRVQERFLWQQLKEATMKAFGHEAIWPYESNGRNHALMINDNHISLIRIQYYKASLGLFNKRPDPPILLEQEFNSYYAGLVHLAPL